MRKFKYFYQYHVAIGAYIHLKNRFLLSGTISSGLCNSYHYSHNQIAISRNTLYGNHNIYISYIGPLSMKNSFFTELIFLINLTTKLTTYLCLEHRVLCYYSCGKTARHCCICRVFQIVSGSRAKMQQKNE